MKRHLIGTAVLGVLLVTGCASDSGDEKPYALTGSSSTNGGMTYGQQVERNREKARGYDTSHAADRSHSYDGVNGR